MELGGVGVTISQRVILLTSVNIQELSRLYTTASKNMGKPEENLILGKGVPQFSVAKQTSGEFRSAYKSKLVRPPAMSLIESNMVEVVEVVPWAKLNSFTLGGLLPDEDYHIWVLVARLTELIFGASWDGWKQEMLDLAGNLILRHNILVEKTQELKSCHVTLHNLVHIVDDIKRFGSPDNLRCYQNERAVMMYIERSTNKNNIECTFAKAEAIRE